MSYLLLCGDARRIPLADQSVHCVVTSPPYWGLRDYGTAKWEGGSRDCDHTAIRRGHGDHEKQATSAGTSRDRIVGEDCRLCGARRVDSQIGLEATPDAFVASMVAVFREVWRVLREDGTLWLNLGDSYNAYNGGAGPSSSLSRGAQTTERASLASGFGLRCKSLKPKDLVGIPWRVALALQADGWYLRSDIVWAKPNPMPESVSDRPTRAHEFIFLLTKSDRYFYDSAAIAEPTVGDHPSGNGFKRPARLTYQDEDGARDSDASWEVSPTRNARTVWTIPVRGFPDAHFATFPTSLPERCIKAGTSERGCCSVCGKPWRRVTKREPGFQAKREHEYGLRGRRTGAATDSNYRGVGCTRSRQLGWEQACSCDASDPVPAVVFDPFNGAATTGVVAAQLGRRYIGTDLNPDYLAMSAKRLRNPFASPSNPKRSTEDFPLFAGMDA